MDKRYACVRVKQTETSKDLLLFSASAAEIKDWVGIPQRLSFGAAETAGFQRTVSEAREDALRKFFSVPQNIIQNPLLCAIRQAPGIDVTYEPSEVDQDLGHVVVKFADYSKSSIADLLKAVRQLLEQRVPTLENRARPDELIASLQAITPQPAGFIQSGGTEEDHSADDSSAIEEALDEEQGEPAEEALFDASQISDFWDQLYAREVIAEKVPDLASGDQVHGFSRAMLESYLRPVILVDGQHRLTGAVLAAFDEVSAGTEAKELVNSGMSPQQARDLLLVKAAKHLPVSLLMNESPAEHVFQYVVVNQKATPVPKALLGTIIATSLAAEELDSIAQRLEDAKIPLEGSKIISILSKAPDSPFCGLVAKGVEDEGKGKLPWSVLGSLADIFRNLEDGRFYHDPFDHAKTWRVHQLEKSKIVEDWKARDFESPYDFWKDINGPWLAVFKSFWIETRKVLASTDNPAARNYWGTPRESNIFNKPSLHILTADFFCFLREMKATIDKAEDVPGLVTNWLEYTSPQYFARDWKLAGVKKDSVGTRKQWSKQWANYRRSGTQPAPGVYSLVYKA